MEDNQTPDVGVAVVVGQNELIQIAVAAFAGAALYEVSKFGVLRLSNKAKEYWASRQNKTTEA